MLAAMTRSAPLADRRILIVGASSGIGAAFALAAIGDGARVVVAARREDRLVELCEEAGGGTVVAGDATDATDARRICDRAAGELGNFDLVLYVPGIGPLNPLEHFDADMWRRAFDVNVVGANLICTAALPHLHPDGVVGFVSTRAVGDVNWGFGAYTVTKAALDQAILAWRVEHPERRFCRVVVGNTQPTEFAHHMNSEWIGPAIQRWEKQGIPGGMMGTDDVGRTLADTFGVILEHRDIDSREIRLDARLDAWPD